jgi:hypothetical protein
MTAHAIRERPVQSDRFYSQLLRVVVSAVLFAISGATVAESVGKTLFLVKEDRQVTAVNAETGQFFELDISAKEVIQQDIAANGVAIVVTNQRFAGVGAWPTGWSSLRRMAGERLVSAEAEDTSAVIVTSDRVLSFNGKTGTWAEKRR